MTILLWLRQLRLRDWVKNGFVLAPLLFAGRIGDAAALGQALLATLWFCLAASAVYAMNDVMDLAEDRKHPEKARRRPLAAGELTTRGAKFLVAWLVVALLPAIWLQPPVAAVLAAYVALNLAYTLALKRQPVIDIFCVATGFVLRVWAGALAIGVEVSGWMFVTTLCLALYLAALKRRQELALHGSDARAVLERYPVRLVERYAEMAGTCALLFYGLFVLSQRPTLIATIPFVMFGLFRYWYLADVRSGGESPTEELLADVPLLLTVLAWIGVVIWRLAPNV